jgi:hypothetical protein
MTDGDAERREIQAAAHSIGLVRIVAFCAVAFCIGTFWLAWQVRQNRIPRRSQMTHRNVPQFKHG